jgi:hypothetical protein
MSCGLGAVVLVFMLVKHNVETKAQAGSVDDLDRVEQIETDLSSLKLRERDLRQALSEVDTETNRVGASIKSVSNELAELQRQLDKKLRTITDQRKQLESIKEKVENFAPAQSSDTLEDQNVGEENYLIGLKVEGRKVAILLDTSASMTDARLLDIIRRKNSSAKEKKAGPKWVRSLHIARWLLARLPKNSMFDVISFNSGARSLGPRGWKRSDDQNAISETLKALEDLVPEGPTNLQRGLEAVTAVSPTNVYLVTDGLPTEGTSNYKSLNPFADCSSLWGSSSTISGTCRLKLFKHSIQSYRLGRRAPVNVILLPIEGDPIASPALWTWASATGGMLISPAGDWP